MLERIWQASFFGRSDQQPWLDFVDSPHSHACSTGFGKHHFLVEVTGSLGWMSLLLLLSFSLFDCQYLARIFQ
jgi:hypothetical protein